MQGVPGHAGDIKSVEASRMWRGLERRVGHRSWAPAKGRALAFPYVSRREEDPTFYVEIPND